MYLTFIRLLPPLCVVFVKKINTQLSRLVIGKLYQPVGPSVSATGNRIQVVLFVLRLFHIKLRYKISGFIVRPPYRNRLWRS